MKIKPVHLSLLLSCHIVWAVATVTATTRAVTTTTATTSQKNRCEKKFRGRKKVVLPVTEIYLWILCHTLEKCLKLVAFCYCSHWVVINFIQEEFLKCFAKKWHFLSLVVWSKCLEKFGYFWNLAVWPTVGLENQ